LAASISEFEKALTQLRTAMDMMKAASDDATKALMRDGVIQRFEFCVELAWKSAVKKLGLATQAPKPAVRDMAQSGYITDVQSWFEFVEARNKSSHTYAEAIALQVLAVIPKFIAHAEELLQKLKA
jgi:nucleotidyltransferase substrate binding protein (TIGR01987 family)